ncbi:multiheme c-type cytochrome [Litoribrevibacter euphylliae]|uniref:Multiheme c-type cytochrome n=1 Tax=Litoribrevibacter euphylliae TaxID=1834034 RepID=A0ABV7HNA2_9GAMM
MSLRLSCILLLWITLWPLASFGMAHNKSSSFVLDDARNRIISANFDTGSVSTLDKASGERLSEVRIGQDIRRIALSSDESSVILATDYLADEVVLLDADSLKELNRIEVPSRPFGVVFDSEKHRFYVTSFEQHKLLVVSTDGDLVAEIDTAETPRGLAWLEDGRLLISHALTGEVSIYLTEFEVPKLDKVIQLAETPSHPIKTTPQGRPRRLDNIAISSDGSQAWLPHVLWSFGHNFQFQSTIFPAVSVLDLTPGKEQERVEERKQLFQQINILEKGNKTRIVSNPHDAVFTEGDQKVVVSLAGSEDLMVFDLSRQGKASKKRHRRKKFQGGAKVTQIYRHVPGDNPKGLVTQGQRLFVQNAMSLDVSTFNLGDGGPFSKIKLEKEVFAELVSEDPLPAPLRLGKSLFNSANSDDYSPSIAGDFWMSCDSCHIDGFNFTNRYLLNDGQKDKYQNALTGHVDVRKMIAGDPVGAYVDIIQKTQGGMPGIDPEHPPVAVAKQMTALNAYVRAQENLPYLSTWLRLDDETPYAHPEDWINSAKCADCHSTIYDQWADSNHGMNMDHPFYRFHEDFAAKEEGEEFRVLCRGCHAPQMVINGESQAFSEFGDMREAGGASLKNRLSHGLAVNERGTGCEFCHRIVKAENAGGNADMTVNLKDRASYIFENVDNPVAQWLADKQINAQPGAHKASYSDPSLYQDSLYCATCHNEFTTGMGANVNDNYGEWLASKFNNPDEPEQHKTCIDCHMTPDVTHFSAQAGRSTEGGPMKAQLRSHHFTGGNYYFTGMRSAEHQQLSVDILKTAATLAVTLNNGELQVAVTNERSGHHLPGGSRRQVWLEVIATDEQGQTLFESGVMRNGYIPKDSRKFIKIGVDEDGQPVGLRFWRYVKIGKDTRIASGETRVEHFSLPDYSGELTVSVRLLYQVFSKQLVETVQAAFPDEDIPEVDVVEMTKQLVRFPPQS